MNTFLAIIGAFLILLSIVLIFDPIPGDELVPFVTGLVLLYKALKSDPAASKPVRTSR